MSKDDCAFCLAGLVTLVVTVFVAKGWIASHLMH